MLRPESQEHRPLQDETISDSRDAEAEEKSLGGIGDEESLVVVAGLLRQREEPRLHGRRNVADLVARHEIASRYGCITRLTRLIRA